MQESYMMRIGRYIQDKRIERGLTEKQLAEGICSVAMIRDIEAGRTFATLDLFEHISERLDLSLQHLLSPSPSVTASLGTNYAADGPLSTTYRQILTMIERMEADDAVPDEHWVSFMLSKADALTQSGKSDAASELLGEILKRVEAGQETDQSLVAVIYQKLGHAYYHAPNMLESYTHYMRAYMISAHLNEYSPLTSRITMDLARVGEQLGGTKQLADQLFELGVKSQQEQDLTRACTYLEQATALYKAHNQVAMGQEMKQAYESLLRTQRHPEQAIQGLIFTTKRLEKDGDSLQLANTYAQKADLHLNLAQLAEAQADLETAMTLFSEDMAAKDPRLTLVYHVQARFCMLTGDHARTVLYGEKAALCYAQMEFFQLAAESLQLVAEAYREQGDPVREAEVNQRIVELQKPPIA